LASLHFDVLTLFPEMFYGFLNSSMIKKAHEKGLVETSLLNFRDFTTDRHQMVDDIPYGGGGGMLLKPEPLFAAVDHLLQQTTCQPPILLMSPQGEPFTHTKAKELAQHSHLILLCGHYEGYDERIRKHLATDEISIGDYVLTGGELPAMVVMDSVSRLLTGVLGNPSSAALDSFASGLLEYPQYTRPVVYRGYRVPAILLSGHHQQIEKWRRQEALRRTWERRPDLLKVAFLTEEDCQFLAELEQNEVEHE
jgi:tRNA (guanine37-N1)-methyltransferase